MSICFHDGEGGGGGRVISVCRILDEVAKLQSRWTVSHGRDFFFQKLSVKFHFTKHQHREHLLVRVN